MRHRSPLLAISLGGLLVLTACKSPAPPAPVMPAAQPSSSVPVKQAAKVNVVNIAGLIDAPPGVISAGGGNIISVGGGSVISAGGGNIISPGGGSVISAGGGNVISAGGGNVISAGGGNVISAGGGNVITAGAGNVITAGAGNVISAGGGNLAPRAGGIVSAAGVITAGAGNVISAGGGNVISAGGGNVITAGAGNYKARRLQAASASPMAGAEVFLADANGLPIKGMLSAIADEQGRYAFINIPAGYTFQVLVVVRTPDGQPALLKTLVRSSADGDDTTAHNTNQPEVPTELLPASNLKRDTAIANVGLATTLITTAALVVPATGGPAEGSLVGAFDPATFTKAVEALGAAIANVALPNLADPQAVFTAANQLIVSVPEAQSAVSTISSQVTQVSAGSTLTQDVQGVVQDLTATTTSGSTSGTGGSSTDTTTTTTTTSGVQLSDGGASSDQSIGAAAANVKTSRHFAALPVGTSAPFGEISGMDVDGNGVLYVADAGSHVIRRLDATSVATIAGTGAAGYTGNSGPATSTAIDTPRGLFVDGSGRVFFCDAGNSRIRVLIGGTLYTYAGGGLNTGDADAQAARLNLPFGLAAGPGGDLYFTERGSGRLRSLSAATNQISTLQSGLTAAGPLAVDQADNRLWYADGSQVWTISLSGGTPQALSLTGATVTGLAYDQHGILYVARSGGTPLGSSGTQIWAVPVDGTGQTVGSSWVTAGSGATLSGTFPAVPLAGVDDARMQALAGPSWCGLAIDLSQAASTTVMSGSLYCGNAFSGATSPNSQVLRLDPRL